MRVCSQPGCPTIYPPTEGSRCAQHRRAADRARGTARDRGYNTRGHQAFRAAVLTRDPICVIPGCINFSSVADHYPLSRKELLERDMNPNDPARGRGLCKPHHDSETAQHQPGGWHT
jgi:5-methylcytosine-specific restriction protein A